jgi:hypothetical protein
MEQEIDNLKKELIKLKKDIDYLIKKQKEREANVSKFFTYESSEDEGEICCCKSLPPQQPCQEIEDYLNSIKMVE